MQSVILHLNADTNFKNGANFSITCDTEQSRLQHAKVTFHISQRIRGYFNEMCYINLRFTYLLTYFNMLIT